MLDNRSNVQLSREIGARYLPQFEDFQRHFFHHFGPFGNCFLPDMRTDVIDAGDAYLLEAELPGFRKEEIQLKIRGDVLCIHAQRSSVGEERDDQNRLVRSERSSSNYTREFDVSGVKLDEIDASYENGVLKLRMPKKQQGDAEERQLTIH